MCRYFLRHWIRGPLSCVLKSFFGYFHLGVGFKAVSMKMLFKKRRHFPVFRESQIASHGEAGRATAFLGVDFISFLIFFRHIVTVWDCVSKHDGDCWWERRKTKVLISKRMTLRVRYRCWYISLLSSAKQQREMTKSKVLCRTFTHDSEFLFSTWTVTPSLQSQLADCSATLDRLNELKLSRTSLK